jgi:MFS family permease
MTKEKPALSKFAIVAFLLNFSLTSLFIVGIPVLITQVLDMGMDLVGISQSVMMLGGLTGGLTAGILGSKLDFKKVPLVLGVGGLSVLPMGLIFMFDTSAMIAYVVMTAVSAISMAALQMGSIQLIAFVQKETPTELTGKVMSLIVMMPFIANATGQLVYGILFEQFESMPWVIILPTVLVSIIIALYARRVVRVSL